MRTRHSIEADRYNEGYKDGKRAAVCELRNLLSMGAVTTGAGIHGWEISFITYSRNVYLDLYKLLVGRMDGKENEQHPEDAEKWISVDERLPKEYQPVIGFYPISDGSDIIESVIYTGEIDGKHTWQVTWNHDKFDANITHWKPYPKRPKDAPEVISSLMGLFPGKGGGINGPNE